MAAPASVGRGAAARTRPFQRLRFQHKLNWLDRRATKQDLRRLIDALIAHNCVEPEDKPLLVAEMNQRLEQASPESGKNSVIGGGIVYSAWTADRRDHLANNQRQKT